MSLTEKSINTDTADTAVAGVVEVPGNRDWDAAVELRVKRKTDSTVLAILFLGLLVFQLDRMNLASALTDGFNTDIGIKQSTVNLGNQLMFLGIVALEIPSNMLLQKLGPRKWISAQVLIFGFVATMQVFVRDRKGFLASRMILGLAEAGYIPGASYTLSTWYTRRELAKRMAVFFFGMFGGNAISPILASGILKLDGRRGLHGWQWLFLLEGCFTMSVALVILFVLPGSPDAPKPLIGPGIVRLSPEEQHVLQAKLAYDDPAGKRSGVHGTPIDLALVWRTVKHYRRWPHYVSTFAVFSTWSSLTTYTPTIVMSLGFDRITANALSAVGPFIALVVVFAFAVVSDKTGRRGLSVIAAQLCYLAAVLIARQVYPHVTDKWSRWGLWTLVNSFAVGYHPNHNSWVQLNCRDAGERSIAVAMWVMSAIAGLMAGTQYFQAGDSPAYRNGLRTISIMISVGIVSAVAQELIYYVHNKHVDEGKHDTKDGTPPIRYTL